MLTDDGSISWKCCAVSNIVFWSLAIMCLCADYFVANRPTSWIARCKLQPNQHLNSRETIHLILLASFNMLFLAPYICCPMLEYIWDYIQGDDRLREDDEWIWQREILVKLPIQALVAEVSFYLVHIILHRSTFLYNHIHKIHHRFIAPTAMACVYAHPIEFAIGNIFPIYFGCMLTNAHPSTCYYIWFPLAMAGTCKGHCGYRIFGMVDPHDDHHLHFRYNFGGMALLDYVFGTLKRIYSKE